MDMWLASQLKCYESLVLQGGGEECIPQQSIHSCPEPDQMQSALPSAAAPDFPVVSIQHSLRFTPYVMAYTEGQGMRK